MRDLLSKLDRILLEETTLQDLKKEPMAKDPVIAKAIKDKEQEENKEESSDKKRDTSWMRDPEDPESRIPAIFRKEREAGKSAGRKTVDALNKQAGAEVWRTPRESFEIGDAFDISISEDFEIGSEIVDILEDGVVVELDDVAIDYLSRQGFTFEEGELVEEKQKGLDGKVCWKGYKRMGTKMKGGKRVDNCVKMGEDLDEYFQFELPKGKDRGPRDHGTDELARREKTMGKGGLAKDARDYKEKDKYGDAYKIKGPKGKLPEDSVEESGLQYYTGKKKYGKEGMAALAAAGRKGASEEELGRIKDKYKKEDLELEAEYQGREVPLGKPMQGDVKKSKVYVKNPQGNVVKVNFGDKKMKIKKSNPKRRKSFRARHNCANPGPRHKARYWSCRAW
jgi:hypothetical protein